ncbi:MAG: ATP-binding protein [Bacteroidales bacterium]|nr:ATP-binding protein [Bacteroidales bacterium]
MYYKRFLEEKVIKSLEHFPVTAILGPRQCGKSTMAKHLLQNYEQTIYLDLERPSDLQKLEDAEWFFQTNKSKLICIDEIQRKPELFPVIRSLVDEWSDFGHFLVLGSASQDLIKQSSESLAGRISFHRLTPFLYQEIENVYSMEDYLIKGGFPSSLLAADMDISESWRDNFIITFIERDILQWSNIMSGAMRRLWQMLAQNNGQVQNYAQLCDSLNVSFRTLKNYLDLLQQTFMLEFVPPWLSNLKKRIIKSPELYLNDTGLICAFSDIRSFNQLSGHVLLGSVWESLVLQHIKAIYPKLNVFFYRTTHGAEVDFVLEYAGKTLAVECKASLSPKLSKGNYISQVDVKSDKLLVVIPSNDAYEKNKHTYIASLQHALSFVKAYFDM